MIYGHGNNLHLYGDDLIDFSSNVIGHIKPINSEIEQHIIKSASTVHNYPEPNALPLQEKLIKFHNLDKIDSRGLVVTNGSTEAFYLIAQLFKGSKTAIFTPAFSEYNDACAAHDHDITYLDNRAYEEIDLAKYDTVWIGNPNNPDGVVTEIEPLLDKYPSTTFIVDEAYADICSNYSSCITLDHPNLIVTKSLTKSFAIPGIRVGYMVLSTSNLNKILKFKQPWSVNSIAIEIGCYIVNNYNNLIPNIDQILAESRELQQKISMIDGVELIETNCNFFLIKVSSNTIFRYLIDNHKILVRDCGNFHGLDSSYIRVATNTQSNNIKLINGLKGWSLHN